jgi:hypothetical protein
MDHQQFVFASYAFTAVVMTAAIVQVWLTGISNRKQVLILAESRRSVKASPQSQGRDCR